MLNKIKIDNSVIFNNLSLIDNLIKYKQKIIEQIENINSLDEIKNFYNLSLNEYNNTKNLYNELLIVKNNFEKKSNKDTNILNIVRYRNSKNSLKKLNNYNLLYLNYFEIINSIFITSKNTKTLNKYIWNLDNIGYLISNHFCAKSMLNDFESKYDKINNLIENLHKEIQTTKSSNDLLDKYKSIVIMNYISIYSIYSLNESLYNDCFYLK